MENLPQTKNQNAIANLLSANMKALKSVLPQHLTPERVMRIAYIAIEQNSKLAQCTHASLINAILESSMLGLEISTPLGEAHLIPYGKKAQLIIGYQGFLSLGYRSGKISKFSIQAVYEKDHFKYQYGTNAFIEHRPSDVDDVGDLKYAYAIAQFKDGSTEFEVVNRRLAMKAKSRSAAKNKDDSPWNTVDEDTMWMKTAARRLAKRLPMSPDIQKAAMLDEYAEAGVKQNISYIPDEGSAMIESASDLTEKLKNDAKSEKPSQTPSDARESTIDENMSVTIQKEKESDPDEQRLNRRDIIANIKTHDVDDIDQAIYRLGWSESIDIDNLSFDQANQLHNEILKEKF